MDEIDPSKESFYLINFDLEKLVQVEGEILEAHRKNLTICCSPFMVSTHTSAK